MDHKSAFIEFLETSPAIAREIKLSFGQFYAAPRNPEGFWRAADEEWNRKCSAGELTNTFFAQDDVTSACELDEHDLHEAGLAGCVGFRAWLVTCPLKEAEINTLDSQGVVRSVATNELTQILVFEYFLTGAVPTSDWGRECYEELKTAMARLLTDYKYARYEIEGRRTLAKRLRNRWQI